nr:endonuclease domain-containing protein [Frigoribacterium faeni]
MPAVPIDPAPKRPRADGPAAPAAPVVDAGERAALLRRVGAAAAGRMGGTAARAADGGPSRRTADGLPSRRADDRPSRTAGDTTSTRPSPVTARARRAAPAPRRPSQLCGATPDLPVGEAFSSACAPPPASAVEQELRADLTAAITFTAGVNAVRIARPFFDHVEAWPDVLLPELRVAVEYDSTGRHGLEHVGHREEADRRKDRALRSAGWEVVRVRTGGLEALGPHDLVVSGLTKSTVPQLLDVFRAVRGDLYVDAWLR